MCYCRGPIKYHPVTNFNCRMTLNRSVAMIFIDVFKMPISFTAPEVTWPSKRRKNRRRYEMFKLLLEVCFYD